MTEPPRRERPWLPIVVTVVVGGLAVAGDAYRYDAASVATYFTAGHPPAVRIAVHLVSLAALVGLATVRTARPAVVWVVAAVLMSFNVLVTSRLVLGRLEHPHVAVAGIALARQEVRADVGYYEGLLCLRTFSRTERAATIDGRTLSPPFLPLPVDWSDLDGFITEMTCTAAAREP